MRIRGFPYTLLVRSLKTDSICRSEYRVAPAWSKYTRSAKAGKPKINQTKHKKIDNTVAIAQLK